MRVRDVLAHKGSAVESLDASEPLAAAIKRFRTSKVRALVVTDEDQLVGILTMRDVLARIDEKGAAAIDEAVREAMTREVLSVAPEQTLQEVHGVFASARINHLPVIVAGELVGLVTPADVLARHVEDVDTQRLMLHAYITNAVL